jgi:hypothetical protein
MSNQSLAVVPNYRARALLVAGALAAAAAMAGCSLGGTGTTNNPPEPIFAWMYGKVTAPPHTAAITVEFRAYSDSLDALAFGTTTGYIGGNTLLTDTGGNYNTALLAAASGKLYLTVLALGQASTGLVYSIDTARAVPMRFDSLNGGPHDSTAVNLTLP